jgi:hypothetical protein
MGMIVFLCSFTLLVLSFLLDWKPEVLNFEVFSLVKDGFLFKTPSHYVDTNLLDEILSIIAILSGLLWGFSKEKTEDEMISAVRKEAMIWAIYVHYSLFILATVLIYGLSFLNILMLNIFTPIIVFLVIYEWKKYQLISASDEK